MASIIGVPSLSNEVLSEVSTKLEKLLKKYNHHSLTLPQARLSSVQRLLQSSIMGFLDVSTHINLRALSKEALKDCDEIGSEFYEQKLTYSVT